MKLKYYLRGLGIGILVSTIILMIAFARHPREMSDKEIISRAQELGMVMEQGKTGESIPRGTENAGSGESDTQQPAEVQDEDGNQLSTETDGQTGDAGQQPEGTEQVGDVPSTEGMNTGEADTQIPEEKFTEFTVEDGESAFSVCIRLYEAGLVDNAYKFNSYLKKKNVVRHVLPRTIEVPEGADYEELAELLTVD